jgi:hypothetical protein
MRSVEQLHEHGMATGYFRDDYGRVLAQADTLWEWLTKYLAKTPAQLECSGTYYPRQECGQPVTVMQLGGSGHTGSESWPRLACVEHAGQRDVAARWTDDGWELVNND